MPKIKLVYCGVRFSVSNKTVYKFINVETQEEMTFSTKLHQFTTMGDIIECEETETGVKSPFTILGKEIDKEKLDYWWTQQASAQQTKTDFLNSKKPMHGSIDELIKRVKENTSDFATRRRVVNYIISKLL